MRPLAEFPQDAARRVKAVLTDIDDTLTEHGRLPAIAYDALERLKTAGLIVVPVTGRPAGWCDLIARQWPVDGVVGENGAFWFRYDDARKTMIRRFQRAAEGRHDDARRLERISRHPVTNGTLEGFFNAAVDAALALQTATLAAETLGLGTCPISVLRNHIAAVGEILALPDKVFPVAGLCLGYPAQQGFISMRLPPEVTVHRDRYDDDAVAAVADYDRRRDARHSLKDRQKSPEVFGTAAFYGWSEDKARQAMSPEGTGFAAWLKARGFNLGK